MYNRLVVPVKSIQQFRRFAPLVRRVPRKRGRHATTRSRFASSHPSRCGGSRESFYSQKQSILREQLCLVYRYSIPTVVFAVLLERKKTRNKKKAKFNRRRRASRIKSVKPIDGGTLIQSRCWYLFSRSFKNVLKCKKKVNGHGDDQQEGLKAAETPESRAW